MLDANFRLKSKERGIQDDPALGSGLTYYVEEEAYQNYLKGCPSQTEVRHFALYSMSHVLSISTGELL